jgi:hypothetical protein
LGFDWDPIKTLWETGIEQLEAFVKEHKHCRVPQQYTSSDGFNLGQWVANRRQKQDRVSPEQRETLNELGFVWKVR